MEKLLIPLTRGTVREGLVLPLNDLAARVNETRNNVVHRGEFRDEDEAADAIQITRQFVEGLVRIYEPEFALRDKKSSTKKNPKKSD